MTRLVNIVVTSILNRYCNIFTDNTLHFPHVIQQDIHTIHKVIHILRISGTEEAVLIQPLKYLTKTMIVKIKICKLKNPFISAFYRCLRLHHEYLTAPGSGHHYNTEYLKLSFFCKSVNNENKK